MDEEQLQIALLKEQDQMYLETGFSAEQVQVFLREQQLKASEEQMRQLQERMKAKEQEKKQEAE